MSEVVYTKSQFANLWGKSQGELKEEVQLVIVENSDPVQVKLVFNSSHKTEKIPDDFEVRFYFRHHLRILDGLIGKKKDVFTQETFESKPISLSIFGSRWRRVRWEVKVTKPDASGWVDAWTELRSVFRGDALINNLLFITQDDLSDGIGWEIRYPDEGPTIVVRNDDSGFKLRQALMYNKPHIAMMIPECTGLIIDELIRLYSEQSLLDRMDDEDTWEAKWIHWFGKQFPFIPHKFTGLYNMDSIVDICNWKKEIVKSLKESIEQSKLLAELEGGDE